MLLSSKIINKNDDIIKFISQDATKLFTLNQKKFMNYITDTASLFENIYKGGYYKQ